MNHRKRLIRKCPQTGVWCEMVRANALGGCSNSSSNECFYMNMGAYCGRMETDLCMNSHPYYPGLWIFKEIGEK